MKLWHLGSYHAATGGDAEAFERQLDAIHMALRLGLLRIVVTLDGGREEREDMRAYWCDIARRLNVACKANASSVELGDDGSG